MFIILTEKTSKQPVYVNIDLVYMMQEHEEETLLFTREQCIIVLEKPKEIIEKQDLRYPKAPNPPCAHCAYHTRDFDPMLNVSRYYCTLNKKTIKEPFKETCDAFEPQPEGDDDRW